MFPIVYIDALVVKVRDGGTVRNKAAYLAVGVDGDGRKHVLGIWMGAGDEGAKYWLSVLTEIKNRGVADVIFVCCDGLKGLPDAIEATWPQAIVQTCVVHLIRGSVRYCGYQDRKKITAALRPIYTAVSADAAEAAMDDFELTWGDRYPGIVRLWRTAGTVQPVPRLPGRDPQGRVHHQPDRVDQLPAPQGHPKPRALPQRRRRPQVVAARRAQHHQHPRRRHGHRHLGLETSTKPSQIHFPGRLGPA